MKKLITALLIVALLTLPIQERSAIQCPNCGCLSPNWKQCSTMCKVHVWSEKELAECERTKECERMMCVRHP
jgi:hypothetical protein